VDQLNALVHPKEVSCIAVLPNSDVTLPGGRAGIKNVFRAVPMWERGVPGIRMIKSEDFSQQISSLWRMSECPEKTEWNAWVALKSKTMTVDYQKNWRNYRHEWSTGHVSARIQGNRASKVFVFKRQPWKHPSFD
jgi:hypothetical protein